MNNFFRVFHPLGSSANDVTVDSWWHHNDQKIVVQACEKLYLTL